MAARPDLDAGAARQADGHRARRHQAAEPADHRHLRRLAARRRADARRGQAGRPRRRCWATWSTHYAATAAQKAGVEVELACRPIRPSRRTAMTAATARCSATSSTTRCRSARRLAHRDRAEPRAAQRAVRGHDRRRGSGHSRGQTRIDLPALLFRAADARISASTRGSGLSICRQIMETYGGSIGASNRARPRRPHRSAPASPCASRRRDMTPKRLMLVHATAVALRIGASGARAAARAVRERASRTWRCG